MFSVVLSGLLFPFLPLPQAIFVLFPSFVLLSMLLSAPIFLHSHLHFPGSRSSGGETASGGFGNQTESREVSAASSSSRDKRSSSLHEEEEDGGEEIQIVFCIEDWNFEGNFAISLWCRVSKRI